MKSVYRTMPVVAGTEVQVQPVIMPPVHLRQLQSIICVLPKRDLKRPKPVQRAMQLIAVQQVAHQAILQVVSIRMVGKLQLVVMVQPEAMVAAVAAAAPEDHAIIAIAFVAGMATFMKVLPEAVVVPEDAALPEEMVAVREVLLLVSSYNMPREL